MKYYFAITIFFSTLFFSCGYTVLQKQTNIQSPLPDLTIVSISDRSIDVIVVDSDDQRPEYIFSITITNRGVVPFEGPIAFAWADNSDDIGWGGYPNFALPFKQRSPILPGDTISVDIGAGQRSYAPGEPFRFLLVTQQVMPIKNCKAYFGYATDVDESNYDNNIYDYIMQ